MSANSQVARNQSRQTFDSVYESTNPLTTVAGQHMVEWFTGNSLNTDRWTTSLVDDATVAMNDSVNGGILFTSGTEGVPKPVCLTYNNFYESSIKWQEAINLNKDDIYMLNLSLHHISALAIIMRSIHIGFSVKMRICPSNTSRSC